MLVADFIVIYRLLYEEGEADEILDKNYTLQMLRDCALHVDLSDCYVISHRQKFATINRFVIVRS